MNLKNIISRMRPHLLPVLILVAAVFAVYWRSLSYDFLGNWDDNRYVFENADIQGFGLDRIKAVFSSYYVGNYAPVQMLSYMLDYWLWGLHASGYHFVNLTLHAINGLLVYRLLATLVKSRMAALSGGAIFLLHPVQVETVAWISQRKNLLAMLFFLVAWEFYRAYRQSESKKTFFYAASLISLLLALLSKSVAVIFPVVMLVFDLCYESSDSRSNRRKLLDKLPFLVIAALAAVMAIYSQTPGDIDSGRGGRTEYHGGSPYSTLLTMLPVFFNYFRLLFFPVNLSVLYDPPIRSVPDVAVVASAVGLALLGYLVWKLYRYRTELAFWPLFYVLALLPVMQIVPLVTLINDRYLYFPIIGACGLVAYAVAAVSHRRRQILVWILLLAAVMSTLTVKRLEVWRDGVTLWKDTVNKSPKLALAWEALGEALRNSPIPDRLGAEKAFQESLHLCPEFVMSRYNLVLLYKEMNELDKAEAALTELLRRYPKHVMGIAVSGDLAAKRYDYAAAERYYRRALALQPDAVPVLQKLGSLMIITNRLPEAREYFLEVDRLLWGNDNQNAYELAQIEALTGDTGAALHWLEVAIERGFSDIERLMADEVMVPVMSDARFTEMMNRHFR